MTEQAFVCREPQCRYRTEDLDERKVHVREHSIGKVRRLCFRIEALTRTHEQHMVENPEKLRKVLAIMATAAEEIQEALR